jgi:xanthine dehydrogenase molybdenum-binding subunit
MDLIINGQPITIDPLPGEMLVDLLRERIDLTGTKVGCNEAECGSCTVVVDGQAVLACVFPAARAAGKEVITIEGLASLTDHQDSPKEDRGDGRQILHPLQEAFLTKGAVQCGFCIPGQIMTAYALLTHEPQPDEAMIRHALKDTLCRCGGYPSILGAVQSAAGNMYKGTPIENPGFHSAVPLEVIGNSYMRPDAQEKVTGQTKFTDDLKFPGMLHARVKRAGVPHAIVKKLNVEKARQHPGVYAVLTAEDIPGQRDHGLVIFDWPVMVGVGERVRTIGDAVAIVAAENRHIATEALDLIETEFDHLPVVADPVQANLPETVQLHPSGNLLKHIKVRKGDIDQGFAEADVIMDHVFHTGIYEHAFIEPECSIARLTPEGRMEVYVGSQIPYADRNQIARVLDWPEEKVRVIGVMIGGGFGGKEDIAGQIHAALLAQTTGRPVKLLFDRHESLLVHPKRHATQIRIKMGAKKDGQLTAVETELYGDTGAYASLGEKVMTRATTHSAGPYVVPHAKADCYAMYTNNPPAGAFRGFGVTQSCFAVESMIDILAERLDIDAVHIRQINALDLGSTTNTGQVLTESVGLQECIQRVRTEMQSRSNGDPFKPQSVDGAPHLQRAWGFAVGYKNTGLGGGAPDKASAEVELCSDGLYEVRTSSAEIGQGLVTVLQLIVAQEFTTSPSQVRVLLSDTDLTPDGGPTTASRQTYVTGNAARLASQVLRQAIATHLAEKYDQPPQDVRFEEGLVRLNGQQLPMDAVHSQMVDEGRSPRALYEYWAPTTDPLGEPGNMHFAFSFAAQAAEVEVNTNTGEVQVLNVIAANDVGKALNPLGLQGQVEGGVVMGLGNALTEHFIVKDGQVVTDHLARYRMPSIVQTPQIHSIVVEHPAEDGPYGAKGVGELSSIPTTPAITNAIYNAVGVRVDRLPVDQEDIVRQLGKLPK